MTCLVAALIILLGAAPASALVVDGVVDTTEGPVQGVRDGERWSFLGIPYAAPPVGERRWRRPEAAPHHDEVLLADEHGPPCPQSATGNVCGRGAPVVGSEDCLTLNVWTPALDGEPRPVMVYVHGGAFTSGCARLPGDGGLVLADDVVLVSIQYRLHALGFFAVDELVAEDADGSTGNYGLLDQLFALAWVRDNIAAFGGDPDNVTVVGQSAGGISICALLASPLADGLFRRVISESGYCGEMLPLRSTLGSPAPPWTAIGRGEALASAFGCGAGDRLACLRAAPAAALIQAPLPDGGRIIDGVLDTVLPYPVIDGYVLSEQPLTELRAVAGRALVVGSNRDELSLFVQDADVPDASAYEAVVRETFGDELAEALLPLYPLGEFATAVEAFRTLATDFLFACPAQELAEAASARGLAVRVYQFTRVPAGAACAVIGAYHSLELLYLFGATDTLSLPPFSCMPDAGDEDLAVALQRAWTSFALDGTPNTTPAWPVFEPSAAEFLDFRVPATVRGDLRDGRCGSLLEVVRDLDPDGDWVFGSDDNCPLLANSSQSDGDGDGVGDACEPTSTPIPTATETPPLPTPTETLPTATTTEAPPSATATEVSPTATPTATRRETTCAGDCAGDGGVGVDELVAAVGVALDQLPAGDCRAADVDDSGTVTADELVRAVRSALLGCPPTSSSP